MSNKIRILVVEDNNDINNLLSDMLIDNGYNVKSAYSGTESLIYLSQEKFNIVLLDLMLPGKSGEEVLDELRKNYKTPVIVISAKEEDSIRPRVLRAGADDFITKPFDLDEVLARIEVNLRRYIQTDSLALDDSLFNYKEIELNVNTREVTVNDSIVNLTLREFEILGLLIKHPNKVFSKDNIFKSVWGEDYISDDNTITVHISNLRNKIAKAGAKKDYIKTIWGIGYKLEV